ncbi:flagellar biosynthetic protein FliO [Thioalkalivibrio sp.]|uniref:flagellar biosynthetic protein FliO n=1 Tax=Thioalkalivibrio sp. TaxID=2093813 RepID=UPI00397630B7
MATVHTSRSGLNRTSRGPRRRHGRRPSGPWLAAAGRCLAWGALCLPGAALAEADATGWPIANGNAMSGSYLVQLLAGLLIVIAAIVVLAFLMRRMPGMQSRLGGDFRVLGGISLGSRERMLLVQVGDTQLLVGVAPGRVQTLHVLDEPLRTEPGRAAAVGHPESPFARRLRSVLQRNHQP